MLVQAFAGEIIDRLRVRPAREALHELVWRRLEQDTELIQENQLQAKRMNENTTVILARDVEAAIVPSGHTMLLQQGQRARITQSLGGSYTVIVNGNMFRIAQKNADALGIEAPQPPAPSTGATRQLRAQEELEKEVWNLLRTCYDPEIPVNIVDLGLVYDCTLTFIPADNRYRVLIKMTLTAPGCGMGPVIVQDVRDKLFTLEEIIEADVDLVFDPPWNQAMISEAAQLQLGIL